MSNRRAQQQLDVAAVSSFCQVAKSVRVFENADESLGLSFTTPNGQVDYLFNFSPDYPEGTVVCSSNISGGLKTVSDPLPVIFHNICSEFKLQVPAFPLVSEALSPSYRTQESTSSGLTDASDLTDEDDIDYDEDVLHWEESGVNSVLETDIRSVQRVFGENSIDYRVHITIDEMDITFYIDLSNFLDEHTAGAWGLKLEESLGIHLHIRSVVKYLDGIEPQVEVFQVPMTSKLETRKIALGSQIRKILQTFVNNQWKKLSNKLVEETVSKCQGREQSQLTEAKKSVLDKLLSAVQHKTPAFLRQKSLGTQIQLTAGEDLDSHKNIPPLDEGFLVQFLTYALNRLKSLNEFCVICDERHVLETGLLKPCVCTRELCAFAFQTLGVMSDAAESLAIDGNVIDLLIAMANAAAGSARAQMILDPYPSIVDPDHPDQLALDPKKPDFSAVKKVLKKVIETRIRLITGMSHLSKKEMDSDSKLTFPLLQWIIATCRAHIIILPDSRQLKSMCTKYQFLLISSPPAKDLIFRQEKAKFGSTFAFHGSNIENWHSIMRKGLINASGTKLQLHGAAYGSGIYLSPSATVSFGYTGYQAKSADASTNGCLASKVQLICLALCEVVVSPALKQQGDIWLCSNPDHVCTRFFFVYEAIANQNPINFDTRLDVYKAEIDHAIGANRVK
ncbi:hypothetical protein EMCRGX_G021450 [Ephydatia muelleri]